MYLARPVLGNLIGPKIGNRCELMYKLFSGGRVCCEEVRSSLLLQQTNHGKITISLLYCTKNVEFWHVQLQLLYLLDLRIKFTAL